MATHVGHCTACTARKVTVMSARRRSTASADESDSPVRALVHACSERLRGVPFEEPDAESVRAVHEALQKISPSHCGSAKRACAAERRRARLGGRVAASIASLFSPMLPGGADAVSSQPVHEDHAGRFKLEIFMLRQGAQLPVHDHPGMSVVSKLLYGCVRIRKFDWQSDSTVRLVRDQTLSPGDITLLFPKREGNLHEITAHEPSAFFDVLTPPYDPSNGRDCTFYSLHAPHGAELGRKNIRDDVYSLMPLSSHKSGITKSSED